MSNGPITFVRVPAARGWEWLVRAHRLFAAYRAAWMLLTLGYLIVVWSISALGIVGAVVATILKPVFGVGVLAAAWSQEKGERPQLQHLFFGFRTNLRALVPVGVVYLGGLLVALQLGSTLDGGALRRLLLTGGSLQEAVQTPGFDGAFVATFLAAVPTLLAVWFAPALVVFQDHGAWRALRASFQAALVNLAPVLVFSMSVFLFAGILPSLLALVLELVGGQAGLIAGRLLAGVVLLAVFALTQIADYVIYRDLFHHGETLGPE